MDIIYNILLHAKRLLCREKLIYFHHIMDRKEKPNRLSFMVTMHNIRNILYNDELEQAILYTISEFPEVMVWSMIEASDPNKQIRGQYYNEYEKSIQEPMDEIDTDLYIGFGDEYIDVIHTYTRLYIDNYHDLVDRIHDAGLIYFRILKQNSIDKGLRKVSSSIPH